MKFLRISILFVFVHFQGIGLAQEANLKAVAKEGDGIYSLLRRHGISPTKFYNKFVALNAEHLGEDESLLMGRSYVLPDTLDTKKVEEMGKSVEYPIFGEQFAKVDVASNRLDDTVYYLISGHGGPDPGAVEKYNDKLIAEDEYAYDVTLRLARELISHGAEVHIIVQDDNDGIRDQRVLELDTDETVLSKPLPLGQLARLKQRTEAVNGLYRKNVGKHQRLLVIHVDSRGEGTNIDVFFYHHEKSKNGKKLAESIHQTFLRKYKKFQPNRLYNGTFMDRNLYVVKNTLPAMAYIEIGNIRSKKDQRRILDPDNRQALAKWISEGILLDYESSKTFIAK
ncbi:MULTISPECIES: N-acetylmuramoyl-L-alanine amidase family protein [Flagellimonas]|uniref:N-acetylmuramoyl-L-alanine amidase n=1 Tax=Flagellimonas hadalis TaxID=2597517 RepID=A0A5N5IQT7_9FLAO|nr:N-acetylmuramoyl-L-alanine amidase [Allomuricauda hadalis]KAB5489408.1 N-acetylmuramoyl-L-alanine amidase [Allomuricauda hadalis]RUA11176.1 MAG: N-acetylmuramoyl-L-alanine amidase [Flavobacteriia bacterium]